MGVFGERSNSYRAVLACGVTIDSRSMDVYFLGSPLGRMLIHTPRERQVTEIHSANEITESMYLRSGSHFVLYASQAFDPDGPIVDESNVLD